MLHPLFKEKYSLVYSQLTSWRSKYATDPYDGILPFVSGLRFSVQLLYVIKDALKNSSLDAGWGHIVDKKGSDALIFSNECDIIIFKKRAGSVMREWNGHTSSEYKAMDFKFINIDSVVGVVSCKGGKIVKSKIDDRYPSQLRKFTANVWLYAEYCHKDKFKDVQKEAKKLKYKDLFCFYEWDNKTEAKAHIASWTKFDGMLLSLTKPKPKKRGKAKKRGKGK